ncbi:hypothetical protein RIF29_14495 [Crotalaria pallida]|uniref:Uncharacterized protein n=1 Tax=Crotalaria pallida TaxID=3830 RepID=A0AAN9IDT7_CROPI
MEGHILKLKELNEMEELGDGSCNEIAEGKSCESAEMVTPTSSRRLQPGKTILRSLPSISDKHLCLEQSSDQANTFNKSDERSMTRSALTDITNAINASRRRLKRIFEVDDNRFVRLLSLDFDDITDDLSLKTGDQGL